MVELTQIFEDFERGFDGWIGELFHRALAQYGADFTRDDGHEGWIDQPGSDQAIEECLGARRGRFDRYQVRGGMGQHEHRAHCHSIDPGFEGQFGDIRAQALRNGDANLMHGVPYDDSSRASLMPVC
jgi:hypothetical protein